MRLFKTRALAAQACRKNRVVMNGRSLKPSTTVRQGETYEVGRGELVMIVRVRDIPAARVAAKLVPDFLEDLTPPERYAAAAERSREQREQGALGRLTMRPSKRDLREIRRWLGQDEDS